MRTSVPADSPCPRLELLERSDLSGLFKNMYTLLRNSRNGIGWRSRPREKASGARDLLRGSYRSDTDLVLLSCCHSLCGKASCSLGQANPGFELGTLHLGGFRVTTEALRCKIIMNNVERGVFLLNWYYNIAYCACDFHPDYLLHQFPLILGISVIRLDTCPSLIIIL
jgi:hypothetical protein